MLHFELFHHKSYLKFIQVVLFIENVGIFLHVLKRQFCNLTNDKLYNLHHISSEITKCLCELIEVTELLTDDARRTKEALFFLLQQLFDEDVVGKQQHFGH